DGADAIILATGAKPLTPAWERVDGAHVVTVWDVHAGRRPEGGTALVVDDGSGFWEAVGAAEHLADQGLRVHLATPAHAIGLAIPFESINPLLHRLGERRVTLHEHVRVVRVEAGGARLADVLTGAET